VGGWLCAVARRLAMSVRVDAARHRRRQISFAILGSASGGRDRLPDGFHPLVEPFAEIERNELRQVLDDELLRLPEKYRAPVVLCDLEGRTHQEAALELGWPSGSISRRLARARQLLRRRLVHRGVFLATGLIAVGVAALFIHKSSRIGDRGGSDVRPLMVSLRSPGQDGAGFATVLSKLSREQSAPELSEVIARARQASQVGRELESHDPGQNRDQWRDYAGEMRRAAELLVQNLQEDNALAMVAAGQRLDASCTKCHEVFRQ
jgi:RNA polymerase sigma factor (sigma-70 family)